MSLDLKNKSYLIEILVEHIYAISLVDVYKTQLGLPREFISDYILNPQYQLTKEEEDITISDILDYQKHLNLDDILYAMKTSCKREKIDFSWV